MGLLTRGEVRQTPNSDAAIESQALVVAADTARK
jgi:hypothetical protein